MSRKRAQRAPRDADNRSRWTRLNREGGEALQNLWISVAALAGAAAAVAALARGRLPSAGEWIMLAAVLVVVLGLWLERRRRRMRRRDERLTPRPHR